MKIKYSPQRSDDVVSYDFTDGIITALINGKSDTFDFTDFPNGIAKDIGTALPINPIVSAKREEGILYVELINFIGKDATEEERFPKWKVIE